MTDDDPGFERIPGLRPPFDPSDDSGYCNGPEGDSSIVVTNELTGRRDPYDD